MPQPNPQTTLVDLILDAARREVLDRVVFSKCRDRAVRRCTVSPRLIKGMLMLQFETLRQATVADTTVNSAKPAQASQENLTLDEAADRLPAMVADYDQINTS